MLGRRCLILSVTFWVNGIYVAKMIRIVDFIKCDYEVAPLADVDEINGIENITIKLPQTVGDLSIRQKSIYQSFLDI